MIVCHCLGLTDRDVRDAAACGGRTRNGAGASLPAGSGCGGCREVVAEILRGAQTPALPAPARRPSLATPS